MNGLYGTSQWGRQGIFNMDDAERETIEDAIPAGYSITVAAERRYGQWSVRLNKDDYTIDTVKPAYDIAAACRTLLVRHFGEAKRA